MDLKLESKTALISGSTAGIGFAIAAGLAREGARVYINGRTQSRVDSAVAAIRQLAPKATVEGIAADLGSASGCDAVLRALPQADILVNNLGIYEAKSFEMISDADWQKIFDTNVMSGVRLSRAYLPGMIVRNWGRIVFISSESGAQIPAEMVHYGMTKTAQLAIARGLAETCAGTAITVNSVLPGPTSSEGVGAFVSSMAEQRKQTPAQIEKDFFLNVRPTSLLKRFIRPEEVAAAVVFVCSPEAAAITGTALRVDGGVVRFVA